MGMTCPTCNGPIAHLFTSSYCPKCEAREAEPVVFRRGVTLRAVVRTAPSAVVTVTEEWFMPSEEVAGIGAWIPSKAAQFDIAQHPEAYPELQTLADDEDGE